MGKLSPRIPREQPINTMGTLLFSLAEKKQPTARGVGVPHVNESMGSKNRHPTDSGLQNDPLTWRMGSQDVRIRG